jgi:hypothetical protein
MEIKAGLLQKWLDAKTRHLYLLGYCYIFNGVLLNHIALTVNGKFSDMV